MKRFLIGFFATAACLALWTFAAAQDNDVIVRVDGQAITRDQVLAANPQAATNSVVANQTVQALINRVLLNKAAEKAALERQPAVQAAMDAARANVLAQAAVEHYLQQHPIDDNEVKQQYESMIKANPAHQYRVRLIIVSKKEEADQLLAQLKAGARFSDLAAKDSIGPNAALGGELGWVLIPQLQASVGTAVKQLKPGEVTGPIVVPEGWAIIQLLQVRPTDVLPLEAVRPTIEQQIRNRMENAYLSELRQHAKIEIEHTASTQPAAAASAAGEKP